MPKFAYQPLPYLGGIAHGWIHSSDQSKVFYFRCLGNDSKCAPLDTTYTLGRLDIFLSEYEYPYIWRIRFAVQKHIRRRYRFPFFKSQPHIRKNEIVLSEITTTSSAKDLGDVAKSIGCDVLR